MKWLHLVWCMHVRWPHDIYKGLREGRGSKENPLTFDDLRPMMKHLELLER